MQTYLQAGPDVYAGCEQREAMATVGVLQLRPDLMGLALEIMTLMGTASTAALGGGGGAGAAAGGGGA